MKKRILYILIIQNKLVYYNKELLQVSFDELEGKFVIHTIGGKYHYESGITNIDDVSYVSSPYIPESLRSGGRFLNSYKSRAKECEDGKSTINDTSIDSIIYILSCNYIRYSSYFNW